LPDNEPQLLKRLKSFQTGTNPPEKIEPLAGDASTRTYFRALYRDGKTEIMMLQPHAGLREEASFLDVQRFLEKLDLPVPRVFHHDPEHSIVILEDLGDDLLESLVQREGDERVRELYDQAVDLLVRMRLATADMDRGCCAFDLAFDEEKLMQEMDFFITHFVSGLCKSEPTRAALKTLEKFFSRISTQLAAEPRVFTHRDYHSKNLMFHRGHLVMIDFQDARMGPAQYDLASLLRDSYITLPEDLVDRLVHRYTEALPEALKQTSNRFRYIFDVTSLHRNIKALGTFGYQAGVLHATRYLSSIPRTGGYVALNISRYPEFQSFRPAVEDYICGPASEIQPPI